MNDQILNRQLAVFILCAFVSVVFSEVGLSAATIKTKDGKIINGKIRGMIVQKGEIEMEQSSEGTIHRVSYDMSNGEDIDAIDEEGVHRTHLWLVQASAVGGLPDDIEVFKPGEKAGLGVERISARGLKYSVLVLDFSPRVPSKDKLLGEFRSENGRDVVIPALNVTTAEGVVEIALADIVTFREKAKEKATTEAPEK